MGDPAGRNVEVAHGPSAESECLEWRSTIRVLQTLKKIIDNKEFYLTVKTKLIGTEGTRLLREMRVQGRPRRRKSAEEAHGPPAESECLEWRSTVQVLQSLKKIIDNKEFYLTVKTKLTEMECTRLLREKRVHGRPRRRKSAEEAHEHPAESECLEWKSTIRVLQTLKKIIDNKEFYLTVKTKLIGTEGKRLLREKRVHGRPRRREAPRRLPDRPRKASAWSGNQRFKFYKQKKTAAKLVFPRVWLQSVTGLMSS